MSENNEVSIDLSQRLAKFWKEHRDVPGKLAALLDTWASGNTEADEDIIKRQWHSGQVLKLVEQDGSGTVIEMANAMLLMEIKDGQDSSSIVLFLRHAGKPAAKTPQTDSRAWCVDHGWLWLSALRSPQKWGITRDDPPLETEKDGKQLVISRDGQSLWSAKDGLLLWHILKEDGQSSWITEDDRQLLSGQIEAAPLPPLLMKNSSAMVFLYGGGEKIIAMAEQIALHVPERISNDTDFKKTEPLTVYTYDLTAMYQTAQIMERTMPPCCCPTLDSTETRCGFIDAQARVQPFVIASSMTELVQQFLVGRMGAHIGQATEHPLLPEQDASGNEVWKVARLLSPVQTESVTPGEVHFPAVKIKIDLPASETAAG